MMRRIHNKEQHLNYSVEYIRDETFPEITRMPKLCDEKVFDSNK
jgi:hypothetical protein